MALAEGMKQVSRLSLTDFLLRFLCWLLFT